MEKAEKKPYKKPELLTQSISSETLRAQCVDPNPANPAWVGTPPLAAICAACTEGVPSG